jgi:hypothetical protein
MVGLWGIFRKEAEESVFGHDFSCLEDEVELFLEYRITGSLYKLEEE